MSYWFDIPEPSLDPPEWDDFDEVEEFDEVDEDAAFEEARERAAGMLD